MKIYPIIYHIWYIYFIVNTIYGIIMLHTKLSQAAASVAANAVHRFAVAV